jgi:hypothetical protein
LSLETDGDLNRGSVGPELGPDLSDDLERIGTRAVTPEEETPA